MWKEEGFNMAVRYKIKNQFMQSIIEDNYDSLD